MGLVIEGLPMMSDGSWMEERRKVMDEMRAARWLLGRQDLGAARNTYLDNP